MRTVLIDSDILRYSHGSIEMRHPFLEGAFVPAPAEHICKLVDQVIASTTKACDTTEYLCILSGKGNFRKDVAKQVEYKGNRDPSKSRPYHYDTITEHIVKNHPFVIVDGHEADDYMGYVQYGDWKRHAFDRLTEIYEEVDPDKLVTIIASRDKDLRTIQGWHYSWGCGKKQPEKPLYYISPSVGMHQFFYQMLIGDSTDNIVGCGERVLTKWGSKLNEEGKLVPNMVLRRKGVGDKGAIEILRFCKTIKDMKLAIFAEYEKQFGTDRYEDILLENARLLFIGQRENLFFEWDWLDKYLSLDNELFDDKPKEKKTRKRKPKTLEEAAEKLTVEMVFDAVEKERKENPTTFEIPVFNKEVE